MARDTSIRPKGGYGKGYTTISRAVPRKPLPKRPEPDPELEALFHEAKPCDLRDSTMFDEDKPYIPCYCDRCGEHKNQAFCKCGR